MKRSDDKRSDDEVEVPQRLTDELRRAAAEVPSHRSDITAVRRRAAARAHRRRMLTGATAVGLMGLFGTGVMVADGDDGDIRVVAGEGKGGEAAEPEAPDVGPTPSTTTTSVSSTTTTSTPSTTATDSPALSAPSATSTTTTPPVTAPEAPDLSAPMTPCPPSTVCPGPPAPPATVPPPPVAREGEQVLVSTWELTAPLRPGDSEVALQVGGGGCNADQERIARIHVTERTDEIIISAYLSKPVAQEDKKGMVLCPTVRKWHPITVPLSGPRGERRLVDPTCSQYAEPASCEDKDRRFSS